MSRPPDTHRHRRSRAERAAANPSDDGHRADGARTHVSTRHRDRPGRRRHREEHTRACRKGPGADRHPRQPPGTESRDSTPAGGQLTDAAAPPGEQSGCGRAESARRPMSSRVSFGMIRMIRHVHTYLETP
ncbi:hypothetical protein KNE206_38970 [Kitasatospora sp. NE20-6]